MPSGKFFEILGCLRHILRQFNTQKRNTLYNKQSYKNVPSESAGSKASKFGGASAPPSPYLSTALNGCETTSSYNGLFVGELEHSYRIQPEILAGIKFDR